MVLVDLEVEHEILLYFRSLVLHYSNTCGMNIIDYDCARSA